LKNVTGLSFGERFIQNPRSTTLKNQHATLLLAVILSAPTFAFADSIHDHPKGENKDVTLLGRFADQEDLQDSSTRRNFLLSSVKENGSKRSSNVGAAFGEFAKGDKNANLGLLLNDGMESDSHPVKLFDFDANQGASSDKDKGKSWGRHNGYDDDGNGTVVASGDISAATSVAEPGSQTLLLVGLAALGMFFSRRRKLTNAI
jgi:MYXO-CTERM domain-containing protein